MDSLVDVSRAEQLISIGLRPFPEEDVPLERAQGRVLRETVRADRDQPPFHRVTMDGISFQYDAVVSGIRTFSVVGIQRAGEPTGRIVEKGTCLEVMTGAVLPEGCDCVVPIERVSVVGDTATLKEEAHPVIMQHVHARGSDYRAGAALLEPGLRLKAPEIAVAASAGRSTLRVGRVPSVAVVATGDELVGVGESAAPHQVRRSNDYAIAAALRMHGIDGIEARHVPDDPDRLSSDLKGLLETNDVVVLTGGVSMGRFDYVPRVLHAMGVKVLFHKVKQRPGKPLLFGVTDRDQGIFALPGNPVSALVCLYRYVLPSLRRSMGEAVRVPERAVLGSPVSFKPDLTWFLPVSLESDEAGRLVASPRPSNTSGDFAALAGTDGFLELEAAREEFPAGYTAPVYRWGA